jgi:uncharacterized protein YukE
MTGNLSAGLSVDTEALDRLADQIRRAAAEARAATADPGPLHATVAALGTPVLVQAVGLFLENWNAALTEVVSDAHRLADAIALVSRSYQDAESVTARMMTP